MQDPANPPPRDVPGGNTPDIADPVEPARTLSEPEPLVSLVPPGARPAPEPLDVDVTKIVLAGTALWAVAFVVLLTQRDRLADAGREWWLWTCVAGVALGLLGALLASRARRASRRRR